MKLLTRNLIRAALSFEQCRLIPTVTIYIYIYTHTTQLSGTRKAFEQVARDPWKKYAPNLARLALNKVSRQGNRRALRRRGGEQPLDVHLPPSDTLLFIAVPSPLSPAPLPRHRKTRASPGRGWPRKLSIDTRAPFRSILGKRTRSSLLFSPFPRYRFRIARSSNFGKRRSTFVTKRGVEKLILSN